MLLLHPQILDIGNLKSAFLAIKSGKKADFSLSVLLNPSYPPPCDLCTPSNVILPVLLECQNIHYSAFLAIKSCKKANFPPLELLNQVCLQFSESSNLYEAISLLTCAVGDSEPSLFRFFDHKTSQKSEFPSLKLLNQVYLLSSESSNPPEAISLLTCAFGDSQPLLFRFFDHEIGQKGEFPSF